ncbi:MAG TPA: hypothetical protein DCQ31_09230 [Bacteroidales bacterium]|nr:hypothetical protein [Bacteroidales bacterium]
MKKLSLSLFAVLAIYSLAYAQKADTTQVQKKERGPIVASLLSTVLPGAGQLYNGKHWKLPIVYGALGTMVYYIDYNNNLYQEYKQKYANFDEKGPFDFYEITETSLDLIERKKEYYRRRRDLLAILTGLVYVLNIADASVDANLKDYDISRDLSIKLTPALQQYDQMYALSVKCTIKF